MAADNEAWKVAFEAANPGLLAHFDHDTDVAGCRFCAVRPMMKEIHFRWNHGSAADRALIWSIQDGYGEAGYTPPQGFDWSGIRDSSPEATRAMYEALIGGIGPVIKDGVVVS